MSGIFFCTLDLNQIDIDDFERIASRVAQVALNDAKH